MCLLYSLAAWFFPSTISNLYDFVDSVNLRQQHQHPLDLQSHKKEALKYFTLQSHLSKQFLSLNIVSEASFTRHLSK